jgi:hypothetical protein
MTFDWRNPDYIPIFQERMERLAWIRREVAARNEEIEAKRKREARRQAGTDNGGPDLDVEVRPDILVALRLFYRDNPADFINDWGMTFDPRNLDIGLPAAVPFLLFNKQREWIDWTVDNWRNRKNGSTKKSRDGGLSWLSVSLGCTLCLHHDDLALGYGSRKEEYVDRLGFPKSLFYKARKFMEYLPPEFKQGWDVKRDAPHMRISFPATQSVMTGEAGDGIGRGDRAAIYFVDESAFLERPALVDASLSATTNCRQDISSANGMANSFYQNIAAGRTKVFTFHWRDDPRKDEAWYIDQVNKLDPVTVAQEIDINFAASVEGVLIPSAWVQSAVDAHIKFGHTPSGARYAALDVADEGRDLNALAGAHGILLETIEEWSGKGSDTFYTTQRAFDLCQDHGYTELLYDADGLGAFVRGDSRVLNDLRQHKLMVNPFRGSGEVINPEKEDVKGRLNNDYFQNRKAQAWWELRVRFRNTYRRVVEGMPDIPDDACISISSQMPLLSKLLPELSQPTYQKSLTGKIVVDKQPDGTRSPNLADAVMMRFSKPARRRLNVSSAAVQGAAA